MTELGTIEYKYDSLGRRILVRVAGQDPIEYEYNQGSLLTRVHHPILGEIGIGYNSSRRRNSLTLPNGIVANYEYNAGNRLLEIDYARGSSSIETISYKYNAAGNRISVDRTNPQAPLPEQGVGYYNESNQMLGFRNSSFAYDANGNLTSATDGVNVTHYGWDARNRLISIDGPGLTARFKYDALGRRVEKTINNRTTQYMYDGTEVVGEIQDGVMTASYLRSVNLDEVLARISRSGVSFYQADGLGSTMTLSDQSGEVKTVYSYDPFGNTIVDGEQNDNPFQYTGRENDGTGLYYYRARYYSPYLQRFISEDPIGARGGINTYAYVKNSPLRYTDPMGTSPEEKEQSKCSKICNTVCDLICHGGFLAGCHLCFHLGHPIAIAACFILCEGSSFFLCPLGCEALCTGICPPPPKPPSGC